LLAIFVCTTEADSGYVAITISYFVRRMRSVSLLGQPGGISNWNRPLCLIA